MDERLAIFEDGHVPLRVLIADLEFLLGALEAVDDTIRQELREQWGVLEEVYAVSLARNDGRLELPSEALVRGAVFALRGRVQRLVSSAPKGSG